MSEQTFSSALLYAVYIFQFLGFLSYYLRNQGKITYILLPELKYVLVNPGNSWTRQFILGKNFWQKEICPVKATWVRKVMSKRNRDTWGPSSPSENTSVILPGVKPGMWPGCLWQVILGVTDTQPVPWSRKTSHTHTHTVLPRLFMHTIQDSLLLFTRHIYYLRALQLPHKIMLFPVVTSMYIFPHVFALGNCDSSILTCCEKYGGNF